VIMIFDCPVLLSVSRFFFFFFPFFSSNDDKSDCLRQENFQDPLIGIVIRTARYSCKSTSG